MPVPQENSSLVEQASCLLSENGAISQLIKNSRFCSCVRSHDCPIVHPKKIY
ncbi:hypothetical protein [Microcoleus sp. B4-C2]|uniref:hypothetical protein n=1 Tax=Microcoleus sp. B4-C2 TaxID=2818661 RepID=UPI002FD26D20